jgi:hypothetical protein
MLIHSINAQFWSGASRHLEYNMHAALMRHAWSALPVLQGAQRFEALAHGQVCLSTGRSLGMSSASQSSGSVPTEVLHIDEKVS